MNTASLDTSIIVRILVRDDLSARRKALKLLGQNLTFVVTDLAISETVYVLETVYRKSRPEVIDLLAFFLSRYDNIKYNHSLTAAVFPFYLDHPKLSFNDCCLSVLAELNHAEPLFTFDKSLAKQSPSAKLLQ